MTPSPLLVPCRHSARAALPSDAGGGASTKIWRLHSYFAVAVLVLLFAVATSSGAPIKLDRSANREFRAVSGRFLSSECMTFACWAQEYSVTAPFAVAPYNNNTAPSTTEFGYLGILHYSITDDGGDGTIADRVLIVIESDSTDPSLNSADVAFWGSIDGEQDFIVSIHVPSVQQSGGGQAIWLRNGEDTVVTNIFVTSPDSNIRVTRVEVDSSKYELTFSQRDWTRLYGYDPLYSGLIVPRQYSSLITSSVWPGYYKNYLSVLKSFQGQVGYYHSIESIPDRVADWIAQHNPWSPEYVFQNATSIAGAVYRDHIISLRAAGFDTDSMRIDWSDIPGMAAVGTWVQSAVQAWWSIQNTQEGNADFGFFYSSYDYYNWNIVTQNTDMIFTNYPLMVHFAGHFTDDFLRQSRFHNGITYTGLLSFQGVTGFYPNPNAPETWELHRTGLVTQTLLALCLPASFQISSEFYLRDRGTWSDARDTIQTSVPSAGVWTNADMLGRCENATTVMVNAMKQWGLIEYQTDYTENPRWALWTLPVLMTYAPSQLVYDGAEYMYSTIMQDLSAHYVPALADSSAPSHRMTSDYVNGQRLGYEQLSQMQFLAVMYEPMCQIVDSSGCAETAAQPQGGLSGDLAPSMTSSSSLVYRAMLAGGLGWHPFINFQETLLASTKRIVKQHFHNWRGQERYNFVSDWYTIGTAGMDAVYYSSGLFQIARLIGAPASQPKDDPNQPTIQPLSYPFLAPNPIQIWTSSLDDPFLSNNIPSDSHVPGGESGSKLINWPVSAQHQSFLLHTFVIADNGFSSDPPSWYNNEDVLFPPLVTDLLVPLGVDGLFMNGVALPTAVGTCMVIPHNNVVLTVRHGDASIITRLILSEHSGSIPESSASGMQPCSTPEWGNYPFSVIWRVDNTTSNYNDGRLVFAHRNAGDADQHSVYRLSLLQGAGITRTDDERRALESVMTSATVSIESEASDNWHSLATVSGWNNHFCEYDGLPACRDCSWKTDHRWRYCPENINWNVSATVSGPGGSATIEVQRVDYYGGAYNYEVTYADQGLPHDSPVVAAITAQYPVDPRNEGIFWWPPITTTPFARLVNGEEVDFPTDGSSIIEPVSDADFFQPHLTPAALKQAVSQASTRKQHTHPATAAGSVRKPADHLQKKPRVDLSEQKRARAHHQKHQSPAPLSHGEDFKPSRRVQRAADKHIKHGVAPAKRRPSQHKTRMLKKKH